MAEYLSFKRSNCKNCYKCIRYCPVKSIRFSQNQADIIPEDCVLCGHCVNICPQNAKNIRDDLPAAKALLAADAPVYVSLAPSFVASFPGATLAALDAALQALGFTGAEETAVGAAMVRNEYERLAGAHWQNIMITTCCHTVNLLVEKYHPTLARYLLPVVSPMRAHGASLKQRHPGAKVVFIGPCISKKAEADAYPGSIDCALTFEDLHRWLDEAGITLHELPDAQPGGITRLFPTSGGILASLRKQEPDYTYLFIDGVENCIHAMEDIEKGALSNCFIEMSACPGGCIGGPAMGIERLAAVRDTIAVRRYAGAGEFDVSGSEGLSLEAEFEVKPSRKVWINPQSIEDVLHQMGKSKPEDELNCGSCGYNTCRDKAKAVLEGKASVTMCLPFLKEKAESFSDTIIQHMPNGLVVLNEDTCIQQINKAACDMINVRRPESLLGEPVVRILDPLPFLEVLNTGKNILSRKTYMSEYDRYADQSVIYDRDNHLVICILRDITEERRAQVRKEEARAATAEIADRVIEKQMRTVQEIASLLGETTAETKVALTKLKESLHDE